MRYGIFFRDIRRETRRCVDKEFSGKSGGEKEMRKVYLGNVRKAGVRRYMVSVRRHYIKYRTLLVETEGYILMFLSGNIGIFFTHKYTFLQVIISTSQLVKTIS